MTDTQDTNRRLERTMLRAWPSFDTVEVDGRILRFADGYTKRANSVNPHFGSTLPVSTRIAHCEALYRARGLPTIFRLTPFSRPAGLDRAPAHAGYNMLDHSLVMTVRVDRVPDRNTRAVLHVSGDEWFAVFDRLRRLKLFERTTHRRILDSA